MLPAWLYTLIACSVTGIWALANVVALIKTGTVADDGIHIVMGTVAGGAFASGKAQRRSEERDR